MSNCEQSTSSPRRLEFGPVILSSAVHLAAFLMLAGVWHRPPTIAAYKLPGTAKGTTLLTYYAAGKAEHSASVVAGRVADQTKLVSPVHAAVAKPTREAPAPLDAKQGLGQSAQSGLGDGEINMAQLAHFPHPKPDLSSLPHGTQGDVVLDAVIDEHGRIASLTLLKGLGEPIDTQVISAVREWTYSPATKNGTPVPSEQELHFHYERG